LDEASFDVDRAGYGDLIDEPLSAVVAVSNDRASEIQILHPRDA
jgi:hypothetical protein